MLSRLAREFAAEIAYRDWSQAPFLLGDDEDRDLYLLPTRTESVRLMVAAAVAQVLLHADPNLDLAHFGEHCGLPDDLAHGQIGDGRLSQSLRREPDTKQALPPGIPPQDVTAAYLALPKCGRCEVDKCEKCLDRGLAWEGLVALDDVTCGCGCWTRDLFDINSPAYCCRTATDKNSG